MLVIGDEILSGRTQDVNLHHLAGRLTEHGIPLAEARVIGDDHDTIVAALRALSTAHAHVFTSGGIGPTHDDITADAVAAAFDRSIGVDAEARARLEAHYARTGIEMNDARLRMARIPEGARLIDNPVSAAPGFAVENVYVMAGVPKIFAAMLDGVLAGLARGAAVLSRSVVVPRGEGDIAAPLADLAAAFPKLEVGSYPQYADGLLRVAVVLRGTDTAMLDEAAARLAAQFPDAVG
jgi:molybdenum cofactor synthesis domain-containing protein